jgi:predicted small secreted protein
MKMIILSLAVMTLTACGTIGGAVEGAGQDLNKAGQYIKKVGN